MKHTVLENVSLTYILIYTEDLRIIYLQGTAEVYLLFKVDWNLIW